MTIQESSDDQWEILRAAPEAGAPPADGRLVIALEPQGNDSWAEAEDHLAFRLKHPSIDGWEELRDRSYPVPRFERLAIVWRNRRGKEIILPTDGYLVMGSQKEATWLPEGWRMDVYPAGWAPAHLERWFDYAFTMVEEVNADERHDIPPRSDRSPPYAPTSRGLVTHAHLIVRHLRLPGSPTEPRGPMDRLGCLAELRDVLDFLRRALQGRQEPPVQPDGLEGGCWLWWQGKRYDVAKGVVYRLLAFMWDKDAASYDELVGPVFDADVTHGTIRARASDVSLDLSRIGVPWRLSADSVSRYLTKQSTEGMRAPKKPVRKKSVTRTKKKNPHRK
jgi:hypothetical protein